MKIIERRLADHLQPSFPADHLVGRGTVTFSPEADRYSRSADAEIVQRDLRKPLGGRSGMANWGGATF
jgi:hypothetical protein